MILGNLLFLLSTLEQIFIYELNLNSIILWEHKVRTHMSDVFEYGCWIYSSLAAPGGKVDHREKKRENTSLAAKGALAHRLQRGTACNT